MADVFTRAAAAHARGMRQERPVLHCGGCLGLPTRCAGSGSPPVRGGHFLLEEHAEAVATLIRKFLGAQWNAQRR
jgi:hypothetical protein